MENQPRANVDGVIARPSAPAAPVQQAAPQVQQGVELVGNIPVRQKNEYSSGAYQTQKPVAVKKTKKAAKTNLPKEPNRTRIGLASTVAVAIALGLIFLAIKLYTKHTT